jgi:uncharacterized protein
MIKEYKLYMKKILLSIVVLFASMFALASIPQKTNRLVNDYASLFTEEQRSYLEYNLVAFDDSTSNQILIITTPSLDGYDISNYAFEIGEKWGVGRAEHNNGLVIVIKPKNQTQGRAFIATGYGLEGILPDAVCKEIVDLEMIPHFKKNDYYGGVVAALNIIMPVAAGEYSYQEARDDTSGVIAVVITLLVVVGFVVLAFGGNSSKGNNIGGGAGGIDPFTAIWLGSMAGRNHGGSFGNFSGGGFGGFGGGSFGGGGAGGSW